MLQYNYMWWKKVLFFLVLLLSLLISVDIALAATFDRNLSVGMSGSDVLALQKILNSNPLTQIASSGSGSPGQETSYFGTLTKKAVIAFQNFYSAAILGPVGLTQGNGFVGASTRNELTLLSNTATLSPTPTSTSVATNNLVSIPSAPLIKATSGVVFSPGNSVTITGLHFTSSSTLYLGTTLATSYSIVSSTTIQFTVPKYAGVLYIWVKNGSQDSRPFTPVFIVVNDPSVRAIPSNISTVVATVTKQNQTVEANFPN